MGTDWENILGTEGTALGDAYEAHVADVGAQLAAYEALERADDEGDEEYGNEWLSSGAPRPQEPGGVERHDH